jgi:chromosome segregation ATPase
VVELELKLQASERAHRETRRRLADAEETITVLRREMAMLQELQAEQEERAMPSPMRSSTSDAELGKLRLELKQALEQVGELEGKVARLRQKEEESDENEAERQRQIMALESDVHRLQMTIQRFGDVDNDNGATDRSTDDPVKMQKLIDQLELDNRHLHECLRERDARLETQEVELEKAQMGIEKLRRKEQTQDADEEELQDRVITMDAEIRHLQTQLKMQQGDGAD